MENQIEYHDEKIQDERSLRVRLVTLNTTPFQNMERAQSFRVGTYKFACVSSLKRALQKSGKEKRLNSKLTSFTQSLM